MLNDGKYMEKTEKGKRDQECGSAINYRVGWAVIEKRTL